MTLEETFFLAEVIWRVFTQACHIFTAGEFQ